MDISLFGSLLKTFENLRVIFESRRNHRMSSGSVNSRAIHLRGSYCEILTTDHAPYQHGPLHISYLIYFITVIFIDFQNIFLYFNFGVPGCTGVFLVLHTPLLHHFYFTPTLMFCADPSPERNKEQHKKLTVKYTPNSPSSWCLATHLM